MQRKALRPKEALEPANELGGQELALLSCPQSVRAWGEMRAWGSVTKVAVL
jgi:hypothetical protein